MYGLWPVTREKNRTRIFVYNFYNISRPACLKMFSKRCNICRWKHTNLHIKSAMAVFQILISGSRRAVVRTGVARRLHLGNLFSHSSKRKLLEANQAYLVMTTDKNRYRIMKNNQGKWMDYSFNSNPADSKLIVQAIQDAIDEYEASHARQH